MGNQQKWPTGLCDCFSDCGTCCCGFWCLPCLFGDNAEKLGDGSCALNCCLYFLMHYVCAQCCFAAPKRGRLRANHNLAEEPCGDCCTHCWCASCAVCQEARLIKRYGAIPAAANYAYAPTAPPTAAAPQQQFMVV